MLEERFTTLNEAVTQTTTRTTTRTARTSGSVGTATKATPKLDITTSTPIGPAFDPLTARCDDAFGVAG